MRAVKEVYEWNLLRKYIFRAIEKHYGNMTTQNILKSFNTAIRTRDELSIHIYEIMRERR